MHGLVIQDFCRLFSIRGYYKILAVIPLMLCITEPHRLEVGAGIFLGLRTWFPERGSSPGKGGRTARHTWRSVSLQPQAIGRRFPEAPRRPQEHPPAPFPLGCGFIYNMMGLGGRRKEEIVSRKPDMVAQISPCATHD